MLQDINHSGYLLVEEENSKRNTIQRYSKKCSYDFLCGELIIHAYENIPEIKNTNVIIAQGYDNTRYLFCSSVPIDLSEGFFGINYKIGIDYVIKGYEKDSKYNELIFAFDELQYFCPSSSIVKQNEDNDIVFSLNPKEINAFDLRVDNKICHVSFNVKAEGKWGIAHSNMEAISEIRISFPTTEDMGFLSRLYNIVDNAFSFICNRRNTTCTSMKIKGECPYPTIDKGKIVYKNRMCIHEVYYFDKYRENPEEKKIIEKTWNASLFMKHIDKLFQLIADDMEADVEERGTISISSIHPSVKRRNLIDLQQSLQVTGAFEFYVRKYLPVMEEEKSHHIIMRMILEEVEKKSTRKLKKLAKSMKDNVVRELALEAKVEKAYKGYSGWKGLKDCISEEWFQENEINVLSHEANLWRNELAHSKRSYEPNIMTIKAIRLIEHLNYAIILRELGYEDKEIKSILEGILKR